MPSTLVKAKHLKKSYPIREGLLRKAKNFVRAVDDVNVDICEKETLGLVGESGCGKTTLGKTLLLLIKPDSGNIWFEDKDLAKVRSKKWIRSRMQIVYQDPLSSLNPRMTVNNIIGRGLEVHKLVKSKSEKNQKVEQLLAKVGLRPTHMNRYPYELSGGQRQRVAIARALALSPRFVVLDEPTSSLDLSVQASVLILLKNLQTELGLSYLFISHNLNVVDYMSHRIGVMYLGEIVELGTADEVLKSPMHPYTKALVASIPIPDPKLRNERLSERYKLLSGEVPSASDLTTGCKYHKRCPFVMSKCSTEHPQLIGLDKDHQVSCHLY